MGTRRVSVLKIIRPYRINIGDNYTCEINGLSHKFRIVEGDLVNEFRKIKPMSEKHIERTKLLPTKYSTQKLPCESHRERFLKRKRVKNSFKYWQPVCKGDGSGAYSTMYEICRKRQCWCIDDKGMFVKQLLMP